MIPEPLEDGRLRLLVVDDSPSNRLMAIRRGRMGGGIPVERVPGNLFAFTQEVFEELRLTAPQHLITTHVRVPRHPPPLGREHT